MAKNNQRYRDAYAMERQNDCAEITMYGEVVREQPQNWRGEPEPGDFIIQSEVLRDLENLQGVKKLTLHMHSIGGDVLVGLLIHNRLRELARAGVEICCVVDGAAMSSASVIMCACDTVEINPCSLVMLHRCWGVVYGAFNADELREMMADYEAHDRAMAAAYRRKTGLSEAEITDLMSETTYLTGEEAVAKGFADKLLAEAQPLEIAASADKRWLFVNGRAFGARVPEDLSLPVMAAKEINNQNETKNQNERGTEKMVNNLEELRAAYPELTAQLEAAAKAETGQANAQAMTAERERLQKIDEVAGLFDPELVQAAKYGENACTAQELTYRAAQAAAEKRQAFLQGWRQDVQQSGAQNVDAEPQDGMLTPDDTSPEQRMENARAEVKALLGKNEQRKEREFR